jgi:hypothetical protein
MTEAQQKRFYFPAWNKCADVNDWRMQKGRFVGSLQTATRGAPPDIRAVIEQVWGFAEQLAAAEHRGLKPDDLRHACTMVVTGKNQSSSNLNNREVQRVVDLFDLLRDPTNLDFVMRWVNPEVSERKNLVKAIKAKAEEAYICAIAKDRFSGQFEYPFWEDLPINLLKQLAMTLNNRNRAYAKVLAHGHQGEEGPF